MKFIPTLGGEMIRIEDIERLAEKRPRGDPEDGGPSVWGCRTRDGRTHRLATATVELLTSTLVPAAPGWFVPEELVKGRDERLVGVSKVPVVAWAVGANGKQVRPVTVDPDLSALGRAVGTPDGRVFLSDGAEFETLEDYLKFLRTAAERSG